MIESVAEHLQGPMGLYVACAFSGLGIPLPEDVPVLYAGIGLARGERAWVPTLLAVVAGVVTRDSLAYLLGRLLGARLLDAPWFRRLIPPEKIDRARVMLVQRGPVAVLVGRFLVGFRAPMFIAAGVSGLRYRTFIAWDALGMLVALPLMLTLGYTVGPPILDVAAAALPRTRELLLLAALIGAGVWAVRRRRAARASSGDEA